ncbi:MAG: N-acetylmuramic acid 6-phosphate etherase [Pseudanabaenaceae cyanobacterium bins.68]|nr:N-acetylmuramic acid 6-phosphate etherase [Pseudanabaenaceae cyanobacterium bins.68]
MINSRAHLLTEQVNPHSQDLDLLDLKQLVQLFHQEDQAAVAAVGAVQAEMIAAIALISQQLALGGRLFYVGAGTSGRLGVLDAAECPPTFCSDPAMIQGLLAGGQAAMVRSSEALEDRAEDGADALRLAGVNAQDVVFGITAGGTTPYVHGALGLAQKLGAKTIFFACVPGDQVPTNYDLEIRPLVGPEILAGSTRLKAGTATKLVLNTISTAVMVQLGKVYGNRMVDVAVTNQKLRDRALTIITDLTGLSLDQAEQLLELSQNQVKLALLLHWRQLELAPARALLAQHQGNLRAALG